MSVYFVTCCEANAVKIGSSVQPLARLAEIQWGCPLPLKLEAVLPGGREEEFGLHARFLDDRIRGEWFTITPVIEDIMAANPPRVDKPRRTKNPNRVRRTLQVFPAHSAVNLLTPEGYFEARTDIHFPFRKEVKTA